MKEIRVRGLLTEMLRAAIRAAQPAKCVPPHLPPPPEGRTVVVGAGKAAAAMAEAVETAWPTDQLTGLVAVPHGIKSACSLMEVIESSHPLPDDNSVKAAQQILTLVDGLSERDLVIALLSGGGSSLVALPIGSVKLQHKQEISGLLFAAGASISDINCVRKHLSAIKGGQLAKAVFPAPLCTLAISDVPGDDPSVIASGPTVADSSTQADAIKVLEHFQVPIPKPVSDALTDPTFETPKPGDSIFDAATFRIVARPADALRAAASVAQGAGFEPILLGEAIEGEARDVARQHGDIAKQYWREHRSCALISGGEVTVTTNHKGFASSGGSNREFALALALELGGHAGIYALSADTDGQDGRCEPGAPIAGAYVDPRTLSRANEKSLDAQGDLASHQSGAFFEALGDDVVTGHTNTNVNDFRAILIEPQDD